VPWFKRASAPFKISAAASTEFYGWKRVYLGIETDGSVICGDRSEMGQAFELAANDHG